MKAKSQTISIFSIICVLGLLLNSGAVFAQGEGEPTPTSNTTPTIILTEPQQNITIQTGEKVSIAWTDDDPDDNASVSLAYDVDSDPANDDPIRWIAQNLPEDPDEDGDRFEWDTTGIPAGTYYLWAVISDSVNAPTYALAAGTLTILEAQSPTEEPTQAPTEEPTAIPTEEPTQVPSEEPTVEPTAIPTQEPTRVPTMEPTQIPTSEPTDEPQFSWKLELIGISSQSETYNAVVNGLESEGAQLDIEANGIILQGTKDLQELRNVLYSDLDGIISLIGGAAEVDIQIPITDTKPITISLESNLSTGYRWFVSSATIDEQAMDYSESYTSREGIGVSYIQTITLQPSSSGTASIHLLYVRPFEQNENISRRLTLQMDTDTSIIDLSDPNPATFSESDYESVSGDTADTSLSMLDAVENAEPLPSSFDWRNYGGVTPIRDQKTCGSCWAFATVGAMESAMAIKTGKYFDLSEQFLVSCNKDGWSCAGGGTAHPYHYNKLGKNQTAIGAVLEAAKPYTNSNSTCTTAYSHPYVLSSWSSISSITVANLKNAIYTYGPIKVSICAGPKFQSYTGGVFTTNESGYCSDTNHAIVLVGWNDATGSWILRNSWGTGWGESGYMRIQYGISRVGKYASWVTFAANTLPTIKSPSGIISDTTPTYTWTKIGGARKYQYELYQGSTLIYSKTVASTVCGTSTCSSTPTDVLPLGDYQWRVAAYVDGAWQPFSAFKSFRLTFTPTPQIPSGTISDTTPSYTWTKISTATYYRYELYKNSSLVYTKTVAASTCGASTCTSTPTNALSAGNYQWRVAAYANGVWQTFSTYKPFTINLTPTPTAPTGTIMDTTPTYAWSKIAPATKYNLQLFQGSTLVYFKTVTSSVCGTSTCTTTPTNILNAGAYQWRVAAYVDGGWKPYSAYKAFTVNLTPIPTSPTGTISDTTPTYAWSKIAPATKYNVQLFQGSTLVYFKTVASTACGTSTCTTTPTNILNAGDYQWRVAAYVDGTWQDFSAYKTFAINLSPIAISPSGIIYYKLPTFTWNKIDSATSYILKRNQGSAPLPEITISPSACGTTTCTYKQSSALSTGNYMWSIDAYVDGKWYPSISPQSFVINDGINSHFIDNAEGWYPISGSWTIEDGFYKGARTSTAIYSTAYDDLFSTLTYEVKVQNNYNFALYFRGTPNPLTSSGKWYSGYRLGINGTAYNFYLAWQGNYYYITDGFYSDNNRPWITIKITANGSFVQIYINGALVATVSNCDRFENGKVGIENATAESLYVDWVTLVTSAPSSIVTNNNIDLSN